ncbi:MAG: hypothetical protein AB7U82_30100 [Blastocatellales bacterium]
MKNLLKRLLAAPFVFIAAIIILLEDWLWDDLQRLAAAIGRLPIFHQTESFITGLPPYGALVMFGTPSLLLIPVKLAALYFIAHGQPAMGFLVAVAAKVAGTALVARIYALTHPNLLRIGWFAYLHARFTTFKTKVYAAIKATAIYRATHLRYARMKEWLRNRGKSFLRRRWDAAVKFSRRWKQS